MFFGAKRFVKKLFSSGKIHSVGQDEFGNTYYEDLSNRDRFHRARRFVEYSGIIEASKISADWYGWLHHQVQQSSSQPVSRFAWQKPRMPNTTGTVHAYYPPGHALAGGKRHRAYGDYHRWRPQ